jgi:hypothetical protein
MLTIQSIEKLKKAVSKRVLLALVDVERTRAFSTPQPPQPLIYYVGTQTVHKVDIEKQKLYTSDGNIYLFSEIDSFGSMD